MVNNIVFELFMKIEIPKIALASKFNQDHEKLISKSTSASKLMSDSLLKNQNSFPDMP